MEEIKGKLLVNFTLGKKCHLGPQFVELFIFVYSRCIIDCLPITRDRFFSPC